MHIPTSHCEKERKRESTQSRWGERKKEGIRRKGRKSHKKKNHFAMVRILTLKLCLQSRVLTTRPRRPAQKRNLIRPSFLAKIKLDVCFDHLFRLKRGLRIETLVHTHWARKSNKCFFGTTKMKRNEVLNKSKQTRKLILVRRSS